jgi:hypothetical protein
MEIQLGRPRIDVLSYNKRVWLTAVELKNSDEEFRRGDFRPAPVGSQSTIRWLS